MKRLLLLLILFGLSIPGAWAQQTDENIYLKQVSLENSYGPDFISGENFFSIFSNLPFFSDWQQLAMDANQIAKINMVGDNNVAELTQSGMGNIGVINIQGNNNDASLDQSGTGLLSILNIQGNFNTLNLDQTGTALQNYVQVTGSGLDFDILQNNSGIEFTQNGAGAIPLSIQRTGRMVPIIINNN